MKLPIFLLPCVLALLPVSAACFQQSGSLSPEHQLAHDIFKQLIEINTTDTPAGNVTTAAEAMAERFRAAGFPAQDIHVDGPKPTRRTLSSACTDAARASPFYLLLISTW